MMMRNSRFRRWRGRPTAVMALLTGLVMGNSGWVHAGDVSFIRDIAPILTQRCTGCHGPTKVEGDYRLHTYEYLLKAGATDAAAIVAGQPDESELFVRIAATDIAARMPQQDDPLAEAEISRIRQWIAEGARFDGRDPKSSFKSQMPPRVHPEPPAAYRLPVPIQALAFSPDGQQLAVSGHYEVTFWNPQTGALLRRIKRLPQRIQSLAFAPDGTWLLVAGGTPGDYGELAVVDLLHGDRPQVLGTFDDLVLSTTLSHDGARVVAASADRSVRAYGVAAGNLLWQSHLHSDWVTCAVFSHDDRFVATGSRDYTIKILDAQTGALFTTYNGHQRQYGEEKGRFEIFALATSDTSPLAFSAGAGRSIRVWEPDKARDESGSAADMEERFAKAGHTRYVAHEAKHGVFQLAVRGNDLFAATGDGVIRQYDVSTLQPVRDYSGHRDWIFAADFHSASQRLAAGAFDGEVRIWNTRTGDLRKSFIAAPGLRRDAAP